MNRKAKVGVMLALSVAFGAGVVWAQSISFRSILKVGGAIAVADRLGPQIDSYLSKVTGQKKLSGQGITTKIVPVLSVGNRKAIGIVQVSGSKAAVDQTKAVAQIETRIPLIGGARAKVLIPINTRSVVNMKRVPGVGVAAVIDMKL